MKRRDLLKALTAAPFFLGGLLAGANVQIDSGHKYIIFVNADAIDPDWFAKIKLPKEVIATLPVHVPEGRTFDDVIRIYETH